MPKRVGYLYDKMVDRDFIRSVIQEAAKGRRNRRDIAHVLADLDGYVEKTYELVATESFVPSAPKVREIYDESSEKFRKIKMVPFWPDGVNANLCRNHILCGKRRIRELYPDAEMPEIYYRPLPQERPAEYMARKEELRSAALRSYTRYISDENFCFIRNHVERIPETDALRGILDALLARADVLKDAVLSGDYVAMRRYADAGSLLASLKSGAERLREWEPPEQEQLDLFTDYSLDGIQDEESMSMSM